MKKNKKRKVYLDNTPLDEALETFFNALSEVEADTLAGETILTENAHGRITKEPVFAKVSSPHYHASAMDGIAVDSKKTQGASLRNPKILTTPQDAELVDTGSPIPHDKNAVIMIEDVDWAGRNEVEIVESVAPWQHVRTIGEDLVATELIVPAGQKLRPVDIGAILAGGVTEVTVEPKPRVAVVPTGTELVEPGERLKPGDVVEFNSRVLSGLVSQWGGKPSKEDKLPDDYDLIVETIKSLLPQNDLIIVNAGSSAGAQDYTYQAIKDMGEVISHGVAIKPGKPVILGIIDKTPVIGIPGYPVSAVLAMELFVKPLLYKWQNKSVPKQEEITAKISRRVVSSFNAQEYLRVKVGKVGDKFVATPLGRGASMIMSLVKSDGMIVIPQMREGLEKGEEIDVKLHRSKENIESTIVGIGSHDISLDILSNELSKRYPPYTLSSAHVGSMGGLMALKRGEAHMAGVHLLDPETGEYNIPHIKKYLSDQDIILVNLAYREQGLLVAKDNPKNIYGLEDLKREDVKMVNRQKGAGTRILLDYKLEELGISSEQLTGYDREEVNHLSVAAAVNGGTADCGLGIRAAAEALDLDFIPVSKERYDIAIPRDFWDWEGIQHILKVIRSEEFKHSIDELSGYDLSASGEILHC
ncbi:molybdopterin biosynthesis protein [Natranaerobius thermophilus]|uniref:Molybdopterin molybdenumtransferase n=1 Tax=Natranaerobius thermophilus (strain ATCC BAA-1301 / DSM 18059 / JW/NM-WN-LF) TaxID=457570 RepID=B2A5V0_NATTJ|nr:molybdopterin biosynthesis protein [Natranaerobius thermophilus]ACB84043.1 molybdenum cofactor synthesis domain protein [Natranaerobius thermophilus JW/NM-WN-LF]